jgi:Uma2 family endonuclease
MATIIQDAKPKTFADLLDRIGHVPLDRIRLDPAPGRATEADVIKALDGADKRLYELVDGVLVEKAMGTKEGMLGSRLCFYFWEFLEKHDLGIVVGADGPFRLRLGLVRFPDVCFVSWERLPDGELPDQAIARVVPDLAVEILSESNTKREMERKLRDYFEAGVRLVWLIDTKSETAQVFSSPSSGRKLGKDQSLDGVDVLPGFRLPLRELFASGRRRGKKSR